MSDRPESTGVEKNNKTQKSSGIQILIAGAAVIVLVLLFKFVLFGEQGALKDVNKGMDLLKQEKFTESETAFASAIKTDPSLAFLEKLKNPGLASMGIANTYLENSDFAAAARLYIKGWETDPSRFDRFSKFVREDYHYPDEIYIELGNLFWNANKPKLSEKAYDRALKSNPNSVSSLTNLGNVKRVLGEIDEAVRMYNLALTCDPKSFEARVNLIGLSLSEERWPAVRMHLEKLEEYFPESPITTYYRAELKKKDGKYSEAVKLFEEYLKIKPDDFNTKLSIVDCYLETGEYDRAQNILREMALRHGSSENLKIRALGPAEKAYANQEFSKAQKYYESMGAIWPNDPQFRFGQANCMIQNGELGQAKIILEDMLHYYPQSSQILCNLGLIYAKMGKNEWAKEQFEAAITIDSPAIAFYNLGKVFESEGDSGAAGALYIRAAMKDPEAFNLEDYMVALKMDKAERIARGDTAGMHFLHDKE